MSNSIKDDNSVPSQGGLKGSPVDWECSGVGGVRGGEGGEGGGEEGGGAAIPGEGVVWFATVRLPWATRCTPDSLGR